MNTSNEQRTRIIEQFDLLDSAQRAQVIERMEALCFPLLLRKATATTPGTVIDAEFLPIVERRLLAMHD